MPLIENQRQALIGNKLLKIGVHSSYALIPIITASNCKSNMSTFLDFGGTE